MIAKYNIKTCSAHIVGTYACMCTCDSTIKVQKYPVVRMLLHSQNYLRHAAFTMGPSTHWELFAHMCKIFGKQ